MREKIDIEALVFWAYRGDQAFEDEADAILVTMAVSSLPEPHRRLVEHFGRAGHPPPWQVSAGRVVSLEHARNARVAYREWLRALVVIRCTLAGELDAFRITGPEAPQEPWRRESELVVLYA